MLIAFGWSKRIAQIRDSGHFAVVDDVSLVGVIYLYQSFPGLQRSTVLSGNSLSCSDEFPDRI